MSLSHENTDNRFSSWGFSYFSASQESLANIQKQTPAPQMAAELKWLCLVS